LSNLDGINPDEKVFHRIRSTFQNFNGELVLTNKGIVFLKTAGMFGRNRERFHFFNFDEIHGMRSEKKGVFGRNIAVDHQSPKWGNRTLLYSCTPQDAIDFLGAYELQKMYIKTPEETESMILRLIKPKGEADLLEVSSNPELRMLIARLHRMNQASISDNQVLKTVRDVVAHLILKGDLDGILTEENRYVSNVILARKTVQYQVVVDFASIYSQLENKGIVLQTLECPSCNGKLEYPKNGDEIICQFCNATVHAVDVFKKFKDLL